MNKGQSKPSANRVGTFRTADKGLSSEVEILSPHQLPPDVLEAVFPTTQAQESVAANYVQADEENEILSPHQLPPDVLEAVFPNSKGLDSFSRDAQRVEDENSEVLSPEALPPEALARIFPKANDVSIPIEQPKQLSEDEQLAVLSPHQLPLEVLEKIFPESNDADLILADKQILDSENQFVLSREPLSEEELSAIFTVTESPAGLERIADRKKIAAELVEVDDEPVEEQQANDQTKEHEVALSEEEIELSSYEVPPYSLPLESLSGSGTQFRLNGQSLNHLTDVEIRAGYQFSNDINHASSLRGTVTLESKLHRSITTNQRNTIEHRGSYFQAGTVLGSRVVSVTRVLPQTANGFSIQLSLTGACLFPETTTQERCSYTPGLSTVDAENVLDFKDIGRLQDDGQLGEVVTPESLAAIEQPGFQRGTDDQKIGLDLVFPNTGTRPGNQLSERATVNRSEISKTQPTFTLARSRQIVQFNDQEAVLGVTLRGNTWISGDKNGWLSAALQAGTALLPDVTPQVAGSQSPANPRINRNLFLAANKVRLPKDSFTLYHGGVGRAASIGETIQAQSIPPAKFRGVWVGISPVTDYRINTSTTNESVGETRTLRTVGAEGNTGGEDQLQFASLVDGDEFLADNIQDSYVQIYQSLLETDGQAVVLENYSANTTYYPHISFTGNTTSFDSVFNYYAGAIVEDNLNIYAGLDYTGFLPKGVTYSLGGVVYTQPDRDYYSRVRASVTKKISFSERASLSFSSGLNWALDRSDKIGDLEVNSRSSSVSLSADARFARFSIGAKGNIEGILPNSARDAIRLKAGIAITDRIDLSGFIVPFSKSSSYARSGVSLSWQVPGKRAPVIGIRWTSNHYEFGTDSFGNELSTNENLFAISFKL